MSPGHKPIRQVQAEQKSLWRFYTGRTPTPDPPATLPSGSGLHPLPSQSSQDQPPLSPTLTSTPWRQYTDGISIDPFCPNSLPIPARLTVGTSSSARLPPLPSPSPSPPSATSSTSSPSQRLSIRKPLFSPRKDRIKRPQVARKSTRGGERLEGKIRREKKWKKGKAGKRTRVLVLRDRTGKFAKSPSPSFKSQLRLLPKSSPPRITLPRNPFAGLQVTSWRDFV